MYTKKHLHRSSCSQKRLQTDAFTQRSSHKQTPLHRWCLWTHKLLRTGAFTKRSFIAHRNILDTWAFTHKSLYTKNFTHTDALTRFSSCTQKPFHTGAVTHRSFCPTYTLDYPYDVNDFDDFDDFDNDGDDDNDDDDADDDDLDERTSCAQAGHNPVHTHEAVTRLPGYPPGCRPPPVENRRRFPMSWGYPKLSSKLWVMINGKNPLVWGFHIWTGHLRTGEPEDGETRWPLNHYSINQSNMVANWDLNKQWWHMRI